MIDILAGPVLFYLELSVSIALAFLLFQSLRWFAGRLGMPVGSAGMSRPVWLAR